MPEAISGVPQRLYHRPDIVCHLINDLPDHLSAGSLLYADDVNLIALRNHHDILQRLGAGPQSRQKRAPSHW